MRVCEIFQSIDGEVNYWGQGTQTIFVRVQGCSLGCSYCDTLHSWNRKGGVEMPVSEVIEQVMKFGCKRVTVTGGEPLEQADEVWALVYDLVARFGCSVSLETNGAHSLARFVTLAPDFGIVMDYKLDQEEKMFVENLKLLRHYDYVKFLVANWAQYDRMKEVLEEGYERGLRARVAVSPIANVLDHKELLRWLQADEMYEVILNVQIHKLIGVR